jgi:uncharacterized protein YbjT (DUF2867 family)
MIVVTGATGNVGRPLVAARAEAGEDVVAVAQRPAGGEVVELIGDLDGMMTRCGVSSWSVPRSGRVRC